MIRFYIGIDQTGAVNSKGILKPLKICIYDLKKQTVQFKKIPHLDWKHLAILLDFKICRSEVFILVDSVLGLPQKANVKKKSIQNLIQMTSEFEFNQKPFGMQTAHHFFSQFISNLKEQPKRRVEVLASANSLFNLHPFQKNISCGTFRIWKDLSADPSWYHIWPYQKLEKDKVLIAEGYPSHYWKSIFNLKSRNPEMLFDKLKPNWQKQLLQQKVLTDQDALDSFVLAWSAHHFMSSNKLNHLPDDISEGWILGL